MLVDLCERTSILCLIFLLSSEYDEHEEACAQDSLLNRTHKVTVREQPTEIDAITKGIPIYLSSFQPIEFNNLQPMGLVLSSQTNGIWTLHKVMVVLELLVFDSEANPTNHQTLPSPKLNFSDNTVYAFDNKYHA